MMKNICYLISLLLILHVIACDAPNAKKQSVVEIHTDKSTRVLAKTKFPIELIEAQIPYKAPLVRSNNEVHFAYEINIANSFIIPFELVKIEVFSAATDEKLIATFDSIRIEENLLRPGYQDDAYRVFSGNQYGIMNLSVSFPASDIPEEIFHRLHFNVHFSESDQRELLLEKAVVAIPETTELIIGPPFREGNWFFYTLGHANTRELTEGHPSFSQRYAVDWVYLDEAGLFMKGPRDMNESYFSYGQEILAVADGEIAAIQDSIPDNMGENEERAIEIDRYNISGNHVVLDIGQGVHVLYAHLIPGSLQVKVGDKVSKGDVLGLLGNSGESTGPHLHFHLESKHKLILGGEGLPFHLEEYELINQYENEIDIDSLFSSDRLELSESKGMKKVEFPMGIGVLRIE